MTSSFADNDGCLFAPLSAVEELLEVAKTIRLIEREQADEVLRGNTLRAQFKFDEYTAKRAADPAYTFREHLRRANAAIEE